MLSHFSLEVIGGIGIGINRSISGGNRQTFFEEKAIFKDTLAPQLVITLGMSKKHFWQQSSIQEMRERNISERVSLISSLLHASHWGLNHNPRMCPDQELNIDLLVHKSNSTTEQHWLDTGNRFLTWYIRNRKHPFWNYQIY